ncbi:MAG: glycosyltransferase involved in cell wall biosynthesis [Moritella sp.]|jgi:glycosyltransferase involved in cell wall biosynthesis
MVMGINTIGINIAFHFITSHSASVSMTKNKIWLLIDSNKPGGIESHVCQLAEGLHHQAENIEVIFLTDYGHHPMHELLRSKGITYRTLDGQFFTLWHALRCDKPTVVHTHGYKAGIYGRFAAKLCNIPVVTTYHAGERTRGKLALYDWIDRSTARLADQVFAVSPQIAERLPGSAKVVNNFINIGNLSASEGRQIAFVGRVSEEKGPDHFASLANTFSKVNFHLYGDGPQLPELTLSSPDNLYLHGQQDDMNKIWPQIGLLIMPSRHEGLPMAALEAMARGIPVLAYRVGALDRLIESKINGWLVDAGDLDELVKHIGLWLNMTDQNKQQLRCASQRTIADKFSSQIVIPELIANYRKISN